MRAVRLLCCAAAIAVFAAPALRADEYNKLTYLTFSAPVQVPGAVLPAGTYMFKLADPDTGRRVIQIWNEEGTNLFTTLLSIPDQLMEPQDDPVVLFTETPAGEPHAIRAWFYPGDRYGYEFVYPKDQAAKIAQASSQSVLAQDETLDADADVAARAGATVGRMSQTGQFESSASARAEQPAASPEAATAAAADPADQTAAPAAPPPASATQPSANRTDASALPPDSREAVGTSGQLPNTASSLPLLQLLAGLSIAGSLGVRHLRRRKASRG